MIFLFVRITASTVRNSKEKTTNRNRRQHTERNSIQLIGVDEFVQAVDDGSQTYTDTHVHSCYACDHMILEISIGFSLDSIAHFSFSSLFIFKIYFQSNEPTIRLCITLLWRTACAFVGCVRALNSQFLRASFSLIEVQSGTEQNKCDKRQHMRTKTCRKTETRGKNWTKEPRKRLAKEICLEIARSSVGKQKRNLPSVNIKYPL